MKNETSSSTFQQQQKDAVTPTLQEHAESFDALIHEAFEQSNNGFLKLKSVISRRILVKSLMRFGKS